MVWANGNYCKYSRLPARNHEIWKTKVMERSTSLKKATQKWLLSKVPAHDFGAKQLTTIYILIYIYIYYNYIYVYYIKWSLQSDSDFTPFENIIIRCNKQMYGNDHDQTERFWEVSESAQALYAYVHTLRSFNGDWSWDPLEAAAHMVHLGRSIWVRRVAGTW